MAQVLTLEDFVPVARYDATPWTQARIEESDTATLSDTTVWTVIETFTLSPVDADPSDPAPRSFTTELASDEMDLWYRVVFIDATADEAAPTSPIQNTDPDDSPTYSSVGELARILKIRDPSDEQHAALRRVLVAAAGEINSEIDLAEGESLSGWQLALAAQVNLERAAELWKLQEVQLGSWTLAATLAEPGLLGTRSRSTRSRWCR
jgi:hypothetical protein